MMHIYFAKAVLATAVVGAVAAGGEVTLLDGDYELTKLDAAVSGRSGALKRLVGSSKAVFHGLDVYANYLYLEGFTVTTKPVNYLRSYDRGLRDQA